jgi:hypothetical protein
MPFIGIQRLSFLTRRSVYRCVLPASFFFTSSRPPHALTCRPCSRGEQSTSCARPHLVPLPRWSPRPSRLPRPHRTPHPSRLSRPLSVPRRPGTPAYKLQVKTEGQLRDRHVSCGPSSRCPTRGSSGAATCPVDPAPAARPGAAPGPPRVLRPQLPLPGPGQLRGRRVCPGSPAVGVLLK